MLPSNPSTGMYLKKVRFGWQIPVPHAHCSTVDNGRNMGSTYKHRNKGNVGYNSILCSLETEGHHAACNTHACSSAPSPLLGPPINLT